MFFLTYVRPTELPKAYFRARTVSEPPSVGRQNAPERENGARPRWGAILFEEFALAAQKTRVSNSLSFLPDQTASQTQFGPAVRNPALGKRVVAIAAICSERRRLVRWFGDSGATPSTSGVARAALRWPSGWIVAGRVDCRWCRPSACRHVAAVVCA